MDHSALPHRFLCRANNFMSFSGKSIVYKVPVRLLLPIQLDEASSYGVINHEIAHLIKTSIIACQYYKTNNRLLSASKIVECYLTDYNSFQQTKAGYFSMDIALFEFIATRNGSGQVFMCIAEGISQMLKFSADYDVEDKSVLYSLLLKELRRYDGYTS